MCYKILIRKDILKSEDISNEALAVYCAICKNYIKYSNNSSITFLSAEYINYLLYGDLGTKRQKREVIDGIKCLISHGFIEKIDVFKNFSGLYDVSKLVHLVRDVYYTSISLEELNVILSQKYVKFGLLRYYLILTGTFDASLSIDKKYRFKISTVTIETLRNMSRNNNNTVIKYNSILSNLKLIYIGRKYTVRQNGSSVVGQISNVYSRYEDRKLCDEYINNVSITNKKNIPKLHTGANLSRKYLQMYNQMKKGKKYDIETVRTIYSYVEQWNCKKRAEYFEAHGNDDGLEKELKSLDVFKEYNL